MEQVRETSAGDSRGDAAPTAPSRPMWRPITPLDETRWSQILRLGQRGDSPEEQRAWSDAWDYLFATFRPALENQVRRVLRRNGFPEQECEDVVQDFWAKCLEKDWLTKADRQIGKFRTFAYVCVRRHCQRVIEARRAKRRTPGRVLSLDEAAPTGFQPLLEQEFDSAWRQHIVDTALARVAQRSPDNGACLRVWLVGGADPDLASPMRLWRARKMLQGEIADLLAETTTTPAGVAQERATLRLDHPGPLTLRRAGTGNEPPVDAASDAARPRKDEGRLGAC